MKSEEEEKRGSGSDARYAAGQAGAEAAQPYAEASDVMREGMEALLEKAGDTRRVDVAQKKGHFFEYIEAAKFNADAARHRSALRASVTDANGSPHAPQDLDLMHGSEKVGEVQAKSHEATPDLAHGVAQEKYEDMKRLVPEDKEARVRGLMGRYIEKGTLKADDYEKARNHLQGELQHGEVSSGGTSHDELMNATRDPDTYALKQEARAVAKEAGVNAAVAGGASFACTALCCGLLNGARVYQGEMSAKEAALDTTKEASKRGGQGAAVGAASAVIRNGAARQGLTHLAQSNVATSVAAASIDLGVTTYDLIRGEITPEEAVREMGQTTTSTMSGLYVGAAAGAMFGPPGMLIGSTAGYLACSGVYQSCMSILKEAELAEKEAQRTLALCEEACEVMKVQRLEFERHVEEVTEARRKVFEAHFSSIDSSLRSGNPGEVVSALSEMATTLDQNLRYEKFEEFDRFMIESDEPLRL